MTGPRTPFLERLGLHRPELRAWAMYDWANSAMFTVVVATVFPVWYGRAVRGENPASTEELAYATTAALTVAAVTGPVLGALGDLRPWKKKLMLAFQAVAVLASAALAFVPGGAALPALLLFAVANVAAAAAFIYYDALLPHVARPEELDRTSSSGYALGYVGGGLALALVLAAIARPGTFGLADRDAATRAGFVLVAVWWVVFSVPIYRRVREPAVRLEAGEVAGGAAKPLLRAAFGRLGSTLRELRRYRDAFTMMLAFLLYNDGIGTIIRMAAKVAQERKFEEETILGALLAVQFVGIPFAFAFGMVARRLGARRCIFAAIAVYVGVTVLASRMETEAEFWLLACLVGAVQGGAQALSRSLFAAMIPQHRSSEFFGIFGVCEKFAGIAGPLLFALAMTLLGDVGFAVLTVLPFFLVGAWLLSRVDVERGRAAAMESDASTAAANGTA